VDYRLHRNKNIIFYVFAGKTRAMAVYCDVKLAINILVEEEKMISYLQIMLVDKSY
jgi:hypothetical protein